MGNNMLLGLQSALIQSIHYPGCLTQGAATLALG